MILTLQVCVTTDNGANIVCALSKSLLWPRLPCFGHNLHLAVTNSIKDDNRVKRALGICRKIVASFSYSWKKKRELSEAQMSMNLPQHSLKSDCATRWGATQLMINTILEQKDAIHQVLRSDSKLRHLCLTWQDLDVLESVKNGFGALDEFTDALSAESEVTASAINAVLHILREDVLSVDTTNDSTLTSDIKTFVMNYMEKKYESDELQSLRNKASYIDLRFCSTYIDDSEKDDVKQMIAEEGVLLIENSNPEPAPTDEIHNDDGEAPARKKRKLGSWLAKAGTERQEIETPLTAKQRMDKEMNRYERSPRADPSSDPLQWWKLNSNHYPVLSQVAKKYLCICASSSASERVFSTSGHIVSKRRNGLKPDKIDMLVFLAKNL